jgi:ornithine decarboxylase
MKSHSIKKVLSKKHGAEKKRQHKKLLVSDEMKQLAPVFDKFGAEYIAADAKADKNNYNATMRHIVKSFVKQNEVAENYDPFFIVDLSSVARQLLRWKKELPRVEPYYAVKCNPNPAILAVIDRMGMGFDCASAEEITQVCSIDREGQSYDSADRIIFANPCKQISHIRHARDHGVKMCTVDNVYEVQKLKQHWPDCHIVLRIKPDDSQSKTPFSSKFGASLGNCKAIIRECKALDMKMVGVSFHVGTGCYSAQSYANTLMLARQVFDLAKEIGGYDFHLLDIGGGYPGTSSAKPSFPEMASVIRQELDRMFPVESGVRIIAEPGRYVCTKSHTLVTNVHSVRDMRRGMDEEEEEDKEVHDDFLLYINDGIYGSMNNIVFDHYDVKINTLKKVSEMKSMYDCTIFGPTCDSVDCVVKHTKLPEIRPQDWLYFTNLGAYTTASASRFNGFGTPNVYYIWKDIV